MLECINFAGHGRLRGNCKATQEQQEAVQCPHLIHGLGAREEGLSIDVYQTAEHFDLLPFSGQT